MMAAPSKAKLSMTIDEKEIRSLQEKQVRKVEAINRDDVENFVKAVKQRVAGRSTGYLQLQFGNPSPRFLQTFLERDPFPLVPTDIRDRVGSAPARRIAEQGALADILPWCPYATISRSEFGGYPIAPEENNEGPPSRPAVRYALTQPQLERIELVSRSGILILVGKQQIHII